jgi:transposase
MPSRHLAMRVCGEAIELVVADAGRAPQRGHIPNQRAAVRRLVNRLGGPAALRACCEDGPDGYALFWQLTALGVDCAVVAPAPGDVAALALAHRDGSLAETWSPARARPALERLVEIEPGHAERPAIGSDHDRRRAAVSEITVRDW